MSYEEKCQLLVIGDLSVGKTSLLVRYVNGIFDSNYLATIGLDFFTKDDEIDGKIVRIKIWDTSGHKRYQTLTKDFFHNAQGIIIVYDVTNSETFENIKFWSNSIKAHIGNDINNTSVIIIGNKIDLNEREVKQEDAKDYCKELGYPYFETSAKSGENVEKAIKYLVKKVLKNNNYNNNNNINITPHRTENCHC